MTTVISFQQFLNDCHGAFNASQLTKCLRKKKRNLCKQQQRVSDDRISTFKQKYLSMI